MTNKKKKIILLSIVGLILIVGVILVWLFNTGKLSGEASFLRKISTRVTVYTNESSYLTGEKVTIGIRNDSNSTITLKNSAPWRIQNSKMVYTPNALQVISKLRPGEKKEWTWNQKGNDGSQFPVGAYQVLFPDFGASVTFAIATSKTITEDFETNMGGWVLDHYWDCEYYGGNCQPDWNIDRSQNQTYSGIYSLEGYLNGQLDDGTIWVERTFNAPANTEIDVNLDFYLWSQFSELNRWPVVAYIGLKDPEKEADFPIIGYDGEVDGWKNYSKSSSLRTGANGTIWVAFGFGATYEVTRTLYLDLAKVTLSLK